MATEACAKFGAREHEDDKQRVSAMRNCNTAKNEQRPKWLQVGASVELTIAIYVDLESKEFVLVINL